MIGRLSVPKRTPEIELHECDPDDPCVISSRPDGTTTYLHVSRSHVPKPGPARPLLDLGILQSIDREELVRLTLGLGLDPERIISITISADAIRIHTFDPDDPSLDVDVRTVRVLDRWDVG